VGAIRTLLVVGSTDTLPPRWNTPDELGYRKQSDLAQLQMTGTAADRMAGLATVHTVHRQLRAELTLAELNPASSYGAYTPRPT